MLTPERVNTEELLDEHDAPREDVERSLRDLRLINHYFGGIRTYRRLLRRLGTVHSVIDLGAGTADLLDSADLRLRIAVDIKIEHLLYMRAASRAFRVVADATQLPFRANAVDAVTSSHFFHHFSDEENATILRESLRVASVGVAVSDTRRHYAPLAFISLVGKLGLVGRITAFDGPASVRRGYTFSEVRDIARTLGAAKFKVVRSWPFRFGLLIWKTST